MRRTTTLELLALLIGTAVSLSCGEANPAPAEPAQEVLATSRHSSIDVTALTLRAERLGVSLDDPDAVRRLLETLAFESELLAEPADDAEPSPAATAATAEAERTLVVERFVASALPALASPSDADVRSRYQAQGDRWQRPARRRVSHLFLRGTANRDARLAEMRSLRQQLLDGASFQALARQRSDSQSRHQGGDLGWIEASGIPAALAEVVFSLAVGVPSEPIEARDGVHLFRVEEANEARTSTLADAEPVLVREIEQERREAALAALVATLPPPSGWQLPAADELAGLDAAAPDAVIARLGDFPLTVGRLRAAVARLPGSPADRSPAAALEQLVRRELLYRRALAVGFDDQPELRRELDEARRRRRLERRIEELLLADAKADDEALAELLAERPQRFSSPLELELRLLTVDLDGRADGSAVMGRLEAAVAALDAEQLGLDALAAELGGSVYVLGPAPLGELAAEHREIPAIVSPLTVGQQTAPRRHDEALELFEVVRRIEPAPRPLAEVRDQLAAALVAGSRPARLPALRTKVLAEGGFQIWDAHLAAWLATRPATVALP